MANGVAGVIAEPLGLERLEVSLQRALDPARAITLFESPDWLGPSDALAPGVRRHLTDLTFPLITKPRTIVFRKAALVDIGRVVRLGDDATLVEVAWRSATLAPLFPVFGGRLAVRREGLFLAGAYAPPFGDLGRLVDRAALHQVAIRTARSFLESVASQLIASTHNTGDSSMK